MTPLTHDTRRAIRYRVNQHARQTIGQPARINDLELLIALGKLTDNEREAWIDTWILGHPSAAIAKRMGVSRQTVCKHERKATRQLIENLGPDFIDRWAPLKDAA